jgi:hypothetical protein
LSNKKPQIIERFWLYVENNSIEKLTTTSTAIGSILFIAAGFIGVSLFGSNLPTKFSHIFLFIVTACITLNGIYTIIKRETSDISKRWKFKGQPAVILGSLYVFIGFFLGLIGLVSLIQEF